MTSQSLPARAAACVACCRTMYSAYQCGQSASSERGRDMIGWQRLGGYSGDPALVERWTFECLPAAPDLGGSSCVQIVEGGEDALWESEALFRVKLVQRFS